MENCKSRDIPIVDLFHNLQLEWISYYIRSKIYDRELDVKQFYDICLMKKDKIDTFSLRNSIPSIFNKEDKKIKYIDEFYPIETNIINFQYTIKNKNWLEKWDKIHFYKATTIVQFENNKVSILKNDTYSNEVEFLTPQREYLRVPYKDVRRDLSNLFD